MYGFKRSIIAMNVLGKWAFSLIAAEPIFYVLAVFCPQSLPRFRNVGIRIEVAEFLGESLSILPL
jgi:hypothetical protein